MGKESKQRQTRETRKPKTAEKREKGTPKYMASESPMKPFAAPPAKKK